MTPYRELMDDLVFRCPRCNRRLDLRYLPHQIFRRIVVYMLDHDELAIRSFGKFYVKNWPSFRANNKEFVGMTKPVRILRFKAGPTVRALINGRPVDSPLYADVSYEQSQKKKRRKTF